MVVTLLVLILASSASEKILCNYFNLFISWFQEKWAVCQKNSQTLVWDFFVIGWRIIEI